MKKKKRVFPRGSVCCSKKTENKRTGVCRGVRPRAVKNEILVVVFFSPQGMTAAIISGSFISYMLWKGRSSEFQENAEPIQSQLSGICFKNKKKKIWEDAEQDRSQDLNVRYISVYSTNLFPQKKMCLIDLVE